MASYTLTIYDIPQENKNIELSYNSNDGRSTESTTIENTTWTFTLQNLSYSKAIYKPGELIFKLQLTGCSGVNAIYNTFKGKKVELVCKENNSTNNIAKGYYIFGIQIEKKREVLYVIFQAYDPFKYLTLDTYCKAYTGKKFIQDIFWNTDLWPNNLPKAIKETQFKNIEEPIYTKASLEQDKLSLEVNKQALIKIKEEKEKDKTEEENKTNRDKKKIKALKNEIDALQREIDEIQIPINNIQKKIDEITTTGKSIFNIKPLFLHYCQGIEFIQPYLVQYNESFFDFLVRVSNRCGEFLYYEDGCFNIGLNIETDNTGRITSSPTAITEYVSVNFSNETATAWQKDYLGSSHHNYSLTDNHMKRFPLLQEIPLDEKKLKKEFGDYTLEPLKNGKIKIEYTDKVSGKKISKEIVRSNYEIVLPSQNSHQASDENLVSLPPKDKYTKWEDFALWPGCYLINVFTDIVNSANIAEAITNVIFSTGAISVSSKTLAVAANNEYEEEYFKDENYFNERKNGDYIHPFSTSESIKNALKGHVTFSLEFYETVRKEIETNERSRIQIALGDHFYPLALGSLIELDGEKYIIVQMSGCANNDAETLDIEAILYEENKPVLPPAAPVSPIREAKAQRAFITHNTDPLKMNRVRVRYPWQGQTEDPTPWIRIALPMASDGSGFNFLPQIGDEAIVNYENGNIEKPYVEGMLYKRAEAATEEEKEKAEEESTVPYAYKRDKARVISSVNGHSIIFSDPSASTNVFNGIIPAWKTLSSFAPSVFNGKLPEYNKKAMGGIELTDEHGLYSISMSSDKRAISIDSPLGKIDINAFTGITISAPNGNVRIEGKNIDIVAGNNLSISSGNNITPHIRMGWKNFGEAAASSFFSKFELIDFNLIRTIFETILRPCGGTMLIKSNRYLCFEAGKGETQIIGRQTIKHFNSNPIKNRIKTGLLAGESYFTNKEITIPYRNNDVATNSIPMHINNFIQAIKAATASFNTINRSLDTAKKNYEAAYNIINNAVQNNNIEVSDLSDFNQFIQNIGNFEEVKVEDPNVQVNIKENINKLNINGKKIKNEKIDSDNIWGKFKEFLQDPVLKFIIEKENTLQNEIKTIFNVFSVNPNPPFVNINVSISSENKRKITYKVLKVLIESQTSAETNVRKIARLPQQDPNFDDKDQWTNFCYSITYENSPETRKKTEVLNFLKDNVAKPIFGYYKMEGMFDQYIWDTNEDAGKILFSDKAGETLNFHNKEIHYYKKAETDDPLTKLKDILEHIK